MSDPTLFEQPPEPQFVDAIALGDVKHIHCNETYALIVFAHGSMKIAPEAFFSLSRVLSRRTDGTL